jgi:hypothetical protein
VVSRIEAYVALGGKAFRFDDVETTVRAVAAIQEKLGWLDIVDHERAVQRTADLCIVLISGVVPEQRDALKDTMMSIRRPPPETIATIVQGLYDAYNRSRPAGGP